MDLGPLNLFPLPTSRMLSFVSRGCWRDVARGRVFLRGGCVLAWWLLKCLALAVPVVHPASVSYNAQILKFAQFLQCQLMHYWSQQHPVASSSPLQVISFPPHPRGQIKDKFLRVDFHWGQQGWHHSNFSAICWAVVMPSPTGSASQPWLRSLLLVLSPS